MSSKVHTTVQVNLVRIQSATDGQWDSYKNNVTVVKTTNTKTGAMSLRILENTKSRFNEDLEDFKWVTDSSAPGIAVISSNDAKVIISYSSAKKELTNFFDDIRKHLGEEEEDPGSSREDERAPSPPRPPTPPVEPPSPEPDCDQAVDQLLQSIRAGDEKKAEKAVKILARDRSNVDFGLISQNSSKKKQTKSSPSVLKLNIQIECHLDRDPIIETIHVPSGTTLRTLKSQIENETGISSRDQYWYAFGKYLINDNYEFGSDKPVVPPRPSNAPRSQGKTPTDPIRSCDTVIMYIARLPPCD